MNRPIWVSSSKRGPSWPGALALWLASLRPPVSLWSRWRRPRPSRRWRIAALVALGVAAGLLAGVVASESGHDLGLVQGVRAFKVAVGLESGESETFSECLKGAAEGAFSSAVPVAEIVAVGELMLASPPLVIMGAGLGCSLGTVKSVALEGVGWMVHTGSGILDGVFGW